MKYTIRDIMPTQITVDFEDGSWAVVPIQPDFTHDQIDDAVSKYDSEFLLKPEHLMNQNISVGEERESKILETNNNQVVSVGDPQIIRTDFGIFEVADYFSSKGDNRLKDALYAKIDAYVSHSNFSIDRVVEHYQNIPIHYPGGSNQNFNYDEQGVYMLEAEDLMKQAEMELQEEENGQQP